MLDVEIALSEKQSELLDSLDKYDVTGYGGAKGGGKSHGLRSVILFRTLSKPGHVGALFRRTYSELEDNHIGPLFRQFPQLRAYYNSGKRELRFPELESEFKFRYCERLSDVDKYAGREFHTLGIEEAGDWPLDMSFRLIRNCNRSTQAGITAASALAFNWGGIGHGGLKRIFWDKRLHEHEKELRFHFILAKVEDNPVLMAQDPGYLKRLESEPNEALRKAYRHGDPNIVAGQYFEIVEDVHIVKPFKIPHFWNWFGSYDYGYNHPAAWMFFTVDTDGNVYLVHEIVEAKLSIKEQATRVNDFERMLVKSDQKHQRGMIFYAGHDVWAKKKSTDPTIAEDFLNQGVVGADNRVILTRANIDRKLGAHRIRQYLQFTKDKDGRRIGPRLQMFSTCGITKETITRMCHNPNDPEDVLKIDATNGDPSTGDDAYDGFRYGVSSRPPISSEPKPWPGTRYDSERRLRDTWKTV